MANHTRRSLLIGASAAAAMAGQALAQQRPPRSNAYRRAIVIDALGGPGGSDPNAEPLAPLTAQDIADVRASGMTATNLTVSAVGNSATAFEETLASIAWCEREIAAHPDVFMKVQSGADLRRAKESGRLGLIYGFQDTYLLGPTLERVAMFHGLGLRISQLTYNRRNLAGDGCLEPANAGLSTFGRQLVEEFNARRILVDLSHSGQRTIREGIAASAAPMAITHTGCRDINDVPRNVWDAELRAMAEKGGVVGMYFMPFLRTTGEQPAGADVIAHIEHAIDVCGEDHVGIGTDGYISPVVLNDAYREAHRGFVAERRQRGISAPGESETVYNFIEEYNEPRRLERLAFDLERRGHSGRRVEKIVGGNFARLFAEVWGA